jgi:23S rRNA (cytosine1962-C5)-methyltransferase
MQLLPPPHWPDYELIDSGQHEKLERFGQQIVARPEPQALWDKTLPANEWKRLAHAYFVRAKATPNAAGGADSERGEWVLKPNAREQWLITYQYKQMVLKSRLGLTAFKHVGIFPEQAANWNYIYDTVSGLHVDTPKILNLFAYTGMASLAARAAGADVTHVDSVKQVVTWSRENMEASGLTNIRWIVDDALKFVSREVRRGNTYHGIILDPPAYGRGPEGEKWILEDNLNALLKLCNELLVQQGGFVVLNLYSMGFSALVAESLARSIFAPTTCECGELYIPDTGQRKLPLGVFVRVSR